MNGGDTILELMVRMHSLGGANDWFCSAMIVSSAPKGQRGNLYIWFILSVCPFAHPYSKCVSHHSSNTAEWTGVHLLACDPTTEEVQKIIMQFVSKSCCLDPVPTYIGKKCLYILLAIIMKVIKLSCVSARVPDCYKIAAIIPLLKNIFLDLEVFSNLIPISTLSLPFV